MNNGIMVNGFYNSNDGDDVNLNDLKKKSMKSLEDVATPEFKQEFSAYLKSKNPLFYITMIEENRFLAFLKIFCISNGYKCFYWDAYRGLVDIFTQKAAGSNSESLSSDPIAMLEYIINENKSFFESPSSVDKQRIDGVNGHIYVLLDFFRFMRPDPEVERRLKEISNFGSIITTILTGPVYKTTEVLENIIPVVDFPYANNNEIKNSLYDVVNGVKRQIHTIERDTKEIEEDLINAVRGLTLFEAQTAYAKSLVIHKKWDIDTILKEKRQIISKSGELEYIEKRVPLSEIGGLKNLIRWIQKRKKCFSKAAEEYGLTKPKGILTIGYPGVGKSLVCKAVSSCWGMPLLRLDFGTLFNSYVGQSEANVRKAIRMAEAVQPSILWVDEIEKAISGIRSSGRSDSGTTSRVLSIFLTWMQEKESSVFVVATANDHSSIPPEFLRAGRFDEIFFVDLPNKVERREIFEVILRKNQLLPDDYDIGKFIIDTDGFSGAEIEKVIENSKIEAFYDGERVVSNKDISNSIPTVIPLSKIRDTDFDELKEWASNSGVLMANESFKEDVGINFDYTKKLDIHYEKELDI